MRNRKKHLYRYEKEYAVYKGDNFIMLGTWFEILEELGISDATLTYYISNAYLKRTEKGKKRLRVIELDDNDDDYE